VVVEQVGILGAGILFPFFLYFSLIASVGIFKYSIDRCRGWTRCRGIAAATGYKTECYDHRTESKKLLHRNKVWLK
jgi:hypothetical protein